MLTGGFLGTSSQVSARRTPPTTATQTAIDAYTAGSGSAAPNPNDPARAYIDRVRGNPGSFGVQGMGVGTPVDRSKLQSQYAAEDFTRGLALAQQFFQGQYEPQMALQQAYRDQLAGRLGFAEVNFGQQQGNLRDQHGIDIAKLELDQRGIGIERGANNRQIGNANTLEQLARQLLGNTQKGFDVDAREALQGFFANTRRAKSDATSRGAMNAPGTRTNFAEIGDTYNNSKDRIGLGREQAGLGFQRERVGLSEQRAAARDRNAMLDLRGEGLGLDRKTLSNNLEQGLSRLGLEQWVTVNDLLDAMNSSDIEKRSIAEQIFRQGLEYSDFFSGLDPAALANMGLGRVPVTSGAPQRGTTGRQAQ